MVPAPIKRPPRPGWPCTLREAGLLGDRPFWQTRLGLVLLVAGAALALETVLLAWRVAPWAHIPMRSVPFALAETEKLDTALLDQMIIVARVLSAVALVLPLWFSARAWTHDLDPLNREQLRAVPQHRDDFLTSRLSLWLGLWVGANVLAVLLPAALVWFIQELGEQRSTLWYVTAGRDSPERELLDTLLPLSWFGVSLRFVSLSAENLWAVPLLLIWAAALFSWVGVLARHMGPTATVAITVVAGIAIPLFPLFSNVNVGQLPWSPNRFAALRYLALFIASGFLAGAWLAAQLTRWFPEERVPAP